MLIQVLDRHALGDDTPLSCLESLGEVQIFDATSPEELCDRIENADVLVFNKVKITADAFRAAKKLKLVCVFATGFDNIDLPAAREHGVAVCNVPGYSTDSVVLFTLANALSLYTHLSEYRGYVASGEYSASGVANRLEPVYHEIAGKTWGIVGYGNIGRAVGRVAEALGARVIVYKRTPVPDAECVNLETLCRESDVLSIHCPLNDSSRGLIGEKELALMKPTAVLINEARGAVLDERAVAEAVLNGRIAAFGCDVYSAEPFPKDHPYAGIAALPNVCLTPHAAWGSYEARERCIGIIAENIRAFLSGERKNRVD